MASKLDLQSVRAALSDSLLVGFDGIVEVEARRTASAKVGNVKGPPPLPPPPAPSRV